MGSLQVQLELADLERKVSLMGGILTETKALQELTGYPYQIYSSFTN